MSIGKWLGFRLRSVARRGELESSLDEELRFHLEMQIAENVKRGLTPDEARLAALRSFGGVQQVKEECRAAWGGGFLEALGQDLRFGLRSLRKNPGFTAIMLLTLGLGIGANTAIFSVIHGVLLRPLPYPDGDRLIVLRQQMPLRGVDQWPFSVREVFDYREQSRTLEGLVEHHTMFFILLGRAEPERVKPAWSPGISSRSWE